MFRDYDCWGFVRDFYGQELGIDLPLVPVDSNNLREVTKQFTGNKARSLFDKVGTPRHFDIVLMGRKRISHCGIYLSDNGTIRILHNTEGRGVICESTADISRRLKIISYHRLRHG